jgi:hypothetical protein
MKLGETLWELPFSAAEKVRLSEALQNKLSLPYRVFADNHRNTRLFDEICRNETRKIPGYRTTSELYRKKLSAKIIKDLSHNKAKTSVNYWKLYKNTVGRFVISNLSALNQLLLEIEMPDSLEVSSENIISEITSHAKDFSVSDKDVESLYEVWPFERLADIQTYLARCPKFDRFRAIEDTIKLFESRIEEQASNVRHQVDDAIAKLEENQEKLFATRKELSAAATELKTLQENSLKKTDTSLAAIDGKLERFEKMIRRSEARRTTERKEFVSETKNYMESIGNDITEFKKRSGDLQIQLAKTRPAPEGLVAQSSQRFSSPYFYLQQHKEPVEAADVDVKSALGTFLEITEEDSATDKSLREIYFYSALMSSCILVEGRHELRLWQRSVGWDRSELIVSASALWVDEDAIAEYLSWLLDAEEEPKTLVIIDFDLGYTSGYLRPFLRAWRHSPLVAYWKKILLVPSNSSWKTESGIGLDVSVLPRCIKSPLDVLESTKFGDFYLPPPTLRKFMVNLSRIDTTTSRMREDAKQQDLRQQDEILHRLPLESESVQEFLKMAQQVWERRELPN